MGEFVFVCVRFAGKKKTVNNAQNLLKGQV